MFTVKLFNLDEHLIFFLEYSVGKTVRLYSITKKKYQS